MDDLVCDCDNTFGDVAVLILGQVAVVVGVLAAAAAWVYFHDE